MSTDLQDQNGGPSVKIPVGLFATYDPHPHARRAFFDDSRFLLMLAGRRGAKTHTGARRMLRMIYGNDLQRWRNAPYDPGAVQPGTAMWHKRRPRLHYWVVADTYKLLKEPMRYLLEFLPPELLEHADASNDAIWLKPDILIESITLHDPKGAVGSGLNGLWMEEAARVSPEAWQGFIMPLLSDKCGWAQFTTTPLGQDWTYEQIEMHADKSEPDYSYHHWVSADNVRSPDLIRDIARARHDLPPEYFRREYEASRDAFIGQIYPFNEATMVVDTLPSGVQLVKRLGGQDWGFTNPGAHIVVGFTSLDPNKAHAWVIDEVYSTQRHVDDYWVPETRKLMAKWKYNEVASDPESPDSIALYKRAGIHAVLHKNYTTAKWDEHERSVRAGIRALSALMHQGRFHVVKSCKNLISELKSYRWDQHKTGLLGGTLIERPAEGQRNHACDAVRYAITYGLKGARFEPLSLAA